MSNVGRPAIYSEDEYREIVGIAHLMRDGGRSLTDFLSELDLADMPEIAYKTLKAKLRKFSQDGDHALSGEELSTIEVEFIKEFSVDYMPISAVKRMIEKNPELEEEYAVLSDPDAGFKLLKRKSVQRKLKSIREQALKSAELNVEYVLTTVMDVIERCKQATPVTDKKGDPVLIDDGDGKLVPAYVFDAANVLKGTDQLGKYLAMWTDKHIHAGDKNNPLETKTTFDVSGLTDEQLKAIASIKLNSD